MSLWEHGLLIKVPDEGVGAGVELLHGGEEVLIGKVSVGDDAFVGVEV